MAEYMKLSIPETSKMVKSLENKGYIIWKLDEKIISNIQEDDLAVTRCTLRKIRQLMEEIK